MAFGAYVDSFVLSTATTGSRTVSPGSLSFAPKGVLFTGNLNSSDGFNTAGIGANWFMGVASTSGQRYMAFESEDAQATSDTGAVALATGCMTGLNANAVVDWVASFTQFETSPNGFTINISDAPNLPSVVPYVLLGGDVTGCEPFVLNLGATSGNVSKTGLAGQPSCVIFFTALGLTGGDTTGATTSANATAMTGWMCADGTQGVSGTRHTDGQAAADTARWQHASRCIDMRTVSANLVSATFVSMDANGFTVNATITTTNVRVYGLAIYGGLWKAGSFVANTGGQSSVTTTGVDPKLLFLQAFGAAVDTNTRTNGSRGLGAADGTRVWTVAYDDVDVADPTAADSYLSRTHALATMTAGIPDTPVLNNALDIVSFGSEAFTYDHTTGATQMEVLYLVGGDTPTGGATPALRARSLGLLGVS